MTGGDVERVAKGLTKYERDMLVANKWNVRPASEYLERHGLVKIGPPYSYSIEITDFGRAVQAHLTSGAAHHE